MFLTVLSLQIPVELPPIPKVDNDTLVMIIEQLLMLTLIIGRWMLPKVRSNKSYLQSCIYACSSLQGSMSRDELAQLLLTYIGTAADIIEFFDSFKVCPGNGFLILQSFFRIQR